MNPNYTNDTHPNTRLDAHGNLDIKLEGWPGATAVGCICAAVVTIFGLFFKSRR